MVAVLDLWCNMVTTPHHAPQIETGNQIMDINITDADRMEMHRLGKEALNQEGILAGHPIAKAAEYFVMANYAEQKELKAEFMVGLTLADYYTENRATKALLILGNGINRRTEVR